MSSSAEPLSRAGQEYGHGESPPLPSSRSPPRNPRENHHQFRENALNEVRQGTWLGSLFFWLTIGLNAVQIVALAVALGLSWGSSCALFLKVTSMVYAISLLVSSICTTFHYIHPLEHDFYGQALEPEGGTSLVMFRTKQTASLVAILALMLAFVETVVSTECAKSAPALYWTVTSIILFNLFLSLFPFLLFTMAICCLPCLLLLLRFRASRNEGLSPEVLACLPVFTYTDKRQTYGEVVIDEEDATCSICLDSYRDDPKIRILHCHHHFHQKCTDQWLKIKAACPLCAAPLPTRQTSPGQMV